MTSRNPERMVKEADKVLDTIARKTASAFLDLQKSVANRAIQTRNPTVAFSNNRDHSMVAGKFGKRELGKLAACKIYGKGD